MASPTRSDRLAGGRVLQVVVALGLVAALGAQSRTECTADLRRQEQAAQSDPEALLKVADYAWSKELVTDYWRLVRAVLAQLPDHPGANRRAGKVRYRGRWVARGKVAALAEARRWQQHAARGLVNVFGVWVAPEHRQDALAGIFRHDGELVSRWRKQRLVQGMVPHPRTGILVAADGAERARNGQFMLPTGEWVDLARADRYHRGDDTAQDGTPWAVRSRHGWVLGYTDLATLEQQVVPVVDAVIESLRPLFPARKPLVRPVVLAAATSADYVTLGGNLGAESSSHGAFLTAPRTLVPLDVPVQRIGVANLGEQAWGPYFTRHAVALAMLGAHCRAADVRWPVWFEFGIGGYAERLYDAQVAAHFGKQHQSKGGVGDLAKWFEALAPGATLDAAKIDFHVFQAGLLVAYCLRAEDAAARAALQAVLDASVDGQGLTDRLRALRELLAGRGAAVRAYFEQQVLR